MPTFNFNFKRRIFNKVYIPLLKNTKRYEVIFGGAGSGKSVFIAQKLIYKILNCKGFNCMVVRNVGDTNRYSTYPLLLKTIYSVCGKYTKRLFSINKSSMTITCTNGNQIIFKGVKDKKDIEKIKSVTFLTGDLNYVWIEEASEIMEDAFEQLDLRLRGTSKIPFQITVSFNPVSEQSWLKARFFDYIDQDASVMRTTYKDNKFIDDAYKRKLEKMKERTPQLYKVYALGEWGTLEEVIYDNWDVIPEMPDNYDRKAYGLDFGFNNPTALVEVREYDREYYLDERIYRRGLDTPALITLMDEIHIETHIPIIADAQDPGSIETLCNHGFYVLPCQKGPGSVESGIRFIKGLKIHVTERSKNAIREEKTYSWLRDRDGHILEKPNKVDDHYQDAKRYAIYTHFRDPDVDFGDVATDQYHSSIACY